MKKRKENNTNNISNPSDRIAISYEEFAERIGVSLPTARRIVKRHNLRVMRFSQTLVRIPIEEIERFENQSLC